MSRGASQGAGASGTPRWPELLAVVLVVLAAAWATVSSTQRGPFLPGEAALHDLAQRTLAPPAREAPPVTVVLVDDESLARLGERWPLDRRTWARFLETLAPLGPTAVLMDAWFESPAPRTEADLALDLADALRDGPLGENADATRLADALEKRAATLDADRRLGAALSGTVRTVLGVTCLPASPDTAAADAPAEVRGLTTLGRVPGGVLGCGRLTASHAALASSATAQAGLSIEADPDGVVRRYPYFFGFGETIYPALGLEGCRQQRGEHAGTCETAALAQDEGRPGLYFRTLHDIQTVRFSDVLEAASGDAAAVPPALAAAARGRLVFAGVSAQGTLDQIRTPLGETVPGVYLHAAAAAALLSDHFLVSDSPGAHRLAWLGLGLLALLAAATLRVESLPLLIGATLLAAAAHLALGARGFQEGLHGALVPALGGFGGFAGVRVIFALRRAAAARRQARAIRHAFQHYVSPNVVEALVRDPHRLRLGGERRTITAFFSDVQGFTTIAEQMDPPALVALLNDVLGSMTECLLNQGGNIDKYIGDAIVAMFGAPLDMPDHAAQACRGALRCQAVLSELRRTLAERGLPEVNVRIGLNTGEALVGNMGSARRFEYTMIGDAVNLAARLEGINSQYGTRILVGEETARQAGDALVFREVDAVRPKGKRQPVRIFELVGEADRVDPATRARLDRFAEGLAAYRAQRFDAAAALFAPLAEAGDPPAQIFLERIAGFREAPPPEQWDAVHTLTSK